MEQGVHTPADFQKFNLRPGMGRSHFGQVLPQRNPAPRAAPPPAYYGPRHFSVGDLERIALSREKGPGVMYTGSLLSVPSSSGVLPDLPLRSQQMPIEALAQMSSNIGVISQQGFNQNQLQYLQSQNSVRKNIVPYPGHPQDHSIPSSSTIANSRSTHPEHQLCYPNVRNALSAMLHRIPETYISQESNLQHKGSRPILYPQPSQTRYPPQHRPSNIPPLSYKGGMTVNNNRPRLPPPPYLDKPPVTRPELPYNFYPFYHQQNKAVQEHFNSGLMSQGPTFPNPHNRIESQVNSAHIPVGLSQPMSSQHHGNKTPTGIADNLVCKNLFDDNPPNSAINTSQSVTNIQENSDDKPESSALTEQVQRPWFMEPSDQVDKDHESVDSLCNPIFGRWYKPPTDEDVPSSTNYEYVWDDSEIEEFSKENMEFQMPSSQPEAVKIHRPVQKSSKGKHNQASRLENQISRIYNSVHIDRVSPIDQVLNSDCVGREVTNVEEDSQMSGMRENPDLQSNSELTNQSFIHQNGQNQSEFSTRLQSDQEMSVEQSLSNEKTRQNVVSEKSVEVDTLQSGKEQNCAETVTSCSENVVEIGNVDSLCSASSNITQPFTYDKTSKKNERLLMRLKKSKVEKKIGGKSLRSFGSQKKVSPIKIKFSDKKSHKKSNSKTKQLTRERKKNQENVAHETVKENKPHKRNLSECFSNVDSNKKVLRVEPFQCKSSLPSAMEKNSDTDVSLNLKFAKDSGDGSEDSVSLSVNHSDLHGKDKLAVTPIVHCEDFCKSDVSKTMTSLCENEDDIGGAMPIADGVYVHKDKTVLTEGTTNDHLHDVVSRIQNSRKRKRSAVMIIPQTIDKTESSLFSTSVPDGLFSPKRKKRTGRTVVTKAPKLVECSVVLEDHFQKKRKLLTSGDNSKEVEETSVLESEVLPQQTSEGDINLKETVEDSISQIEDPDRSANKHAESEDEGLSIDVSTSGQESSNKVLNTNKSDVNIKVLDNGCDTVTECQESEFESSTQITLETCKEKNEENKQKKMVAQKKEMKEFCNNTTVIHKMSGIKDKHDKDQKNASPFMIASESDMECDITKGLNGSTHVNDSKYDSSITIASESDMECDLKNGLNSGIQDKDPKNASPVIISSDSDMECELENSMNVSTSCNESCDINRIDKSSFYVRFHDERLLCLSNSNSKYFIMREFLRNCFQNATQKTAQNQGNLGHSNQSYKHIYIAKERDLNIPYKALPESMREQVKNYLVKENLLKPLQNVMHIGIIHVSDAKRLYHFFFGVKSCGDVNCISEWSSNWMPRKRSTDQMDLNRSREKSHHRTHNDKPVEKETESVEKDKTADGQGRKKRKKKCRGKGKKKKQHTKKISKDERHKIEEEATSRYLQEILKKKSQETAVSSNSDRETISCQVIHDRSSADDSDATIPYVEHDLEDPAEVEKNNSVGHVAEKKDSETREIPDNNVDYVIKGGIAELFGGLFRFLVVNDRKFYPFSDLCDHFDKDMIYSCIKDSPNKYKAVRCSPVERDFLNPLESTLPVLSENATIVEEDLLYKVAKMNFKNMFDDDKEKYNKLGEKGQDGLDSQMSTSFGSENTSALDTSHDVLLYEIGLSPKADKKSAEHHGDSADSPVSNATDINRNKIKLPNVSSAGAIDAADMDPQDKSDEGKCKTISVAVINSPNKGQGSQHGKSCTDRSTSPQTKSTGLCDETIGKNQHSIAVACQGLLQQNASLKDRLIRLKKNTEDVSKGTRKFEQYEAEVESLINQMKKKNKGDVQEPSTQRQYTG